MNDSNNNNKIVKLINGCSVHIDLLDFVRFVVTERIPVLSPNNAFELKQICGEEKWDNLDTINKIEAGYCMVHLVEKRVVPFNAVKGKHEYPKLYQLTSTKLGTRIP